MTPEEFLIKRTPLMILAQAQQDHATELVVDPAVPGGTSVRYKIGGTWHDWKGPHPDVVPGMVAELGRLAGFHEGPYPKEGAIDVPYSGVRLRWRIRMTSAGAECILTPIER